MNYAYYFEHDRYDWHLDNPPKGGPSGLVIPPNETVPEVRVSIHQKYCRRYPQKLLDCYCVAKRYTGEALPAACRPFQNVTNFDLFVFDSGNHHLGSWCSKGKGHRDCAERIEAHYQNFRKYYQSEYDLDLRRVRVVEEAAKRENITCQEVFKFDFQSLNKNST